MNKKKEIVEAEIVEHNVSNELTIHSPNVITTPQRQHLHF